MKKRSKHEKKTIRKALPVPKVRIDIYGQDYPNGTLIYLDGKALFGITEFTLKQKGCNKSELTIVLNANVVMFTDTPSSKI